jgi:hypothetical protein
VVEPFCSGSILSGADYFMDLKQYYRKINELEASLTDKYPVVVSLETPDGGKAGVVAEVSRPIAAKLVIEGRAVLASVAEKAQYLEQQAIAKQQAEKAEMARRVQVAIITDRDLKPLSSVKNENDPASDRA